MRMGFCALAKDEIPSTSIYEAKNAMKAVQKKGKFPWPKTKNAEHSKRD